MTITISKNKILIMAICLLLILNVSIFSTMAWMTDTAKLVNTFTVGKVDITLEETDVDEDGDTTKNSYHLIPGQEYKKDPTLTVLKDSEESYIRMIMTIYGWSEAVEAFELKEPKDFFKLLGGYDGEIWKHAATVKDTSQDTMSFEFRYKETVSGFNDENKGEEKELKPLFDTLKMPGALTIQDLDKLKDGGFKMVIEGHAIQSAGFETTKDDEGNTIPAEDAAWAAFVKEENEEE